MSVKEVQSKADIMNQTEYVSLVDSKNQNDLTCYNLKDSESMVKFLFHLSSSMQHTVIGIGIVGIILNLTGVYILSTRKSMKNTFNQLLVTLYCIDSLFLCAYVYLSVSLTYIKSQHLSNTIASRFVKLFYSFAFKVSIFLTVATSHERYIAMLKPVVHFASVSTESNQRLRLMKYLIPIITIAAILNIPEYLELEFVWEESSNSLRNNTLNNRYSITPYLFLKTMFKQSKTFIYVFSFTFML